MSLRPLTKIEQHELRRLQRVYPTFTTPQYATDASAHFANKASETSGREKGEYLNKSDDCFKLAFLLERQGATK